MNIQCPSCQKLLQVDERYAGQLMKCPLCNNTFTLPALAPPPPEPPPPEPAAAPDPFADLGGAPAAPRPPAADPFTAPSPPPAPPGVDLPPAPPEPARQPAGYTTAYTLWFNPDALRYVAPVCVVLIFILQFFPWVGVYPGGVPLATQGAWGAAFAIVTPEGDTEAALRETSPRFVTTEALVQKTTANAAMIFYVLLFLLVCLPLTVFALVLEFVPVRLPPPVERYVPMRWAIVAVANGVVFLFLLLQLVAGFSLESVVLDREAGESAAKAPRNTIEQRQADIARGLAASVLLRTVWLRLAVLLHLLAIAGASLVHCIRRRGDRPLPRLELLW